MGQAAVRNRFNQLHAEREAKEDRRIPLKEVARKAGVSANTLTKWTNTEVLRSIDVETMEKLAAYFGLDNPLDMLEYS